MLLQVSAQYSPQSGQQGYRYLCFKLLRQCFLESSNYLSSISSIVRWSEYLMQSCQHT